jgi:drug/metabolite transporter (DMT)-like permease
MTTRPQRLPDSAAPGWIPALFVLLWSTGFLGAKLGLPYAEPFTFLGIRMAIATALLLLFALAISAPWPERWTSVAHIAIAGLLVHAFYLGGVFLAIHWGLPAGLSSLIVGLQPLLTAALAMIWLKERLRPRQWLGLLLGFAGVTLVLAGRVGGLGPGHEWSAMVPVLTALVAITLGTLYQKRYCAGMDLRTGGVIQYAACKVLFALAALLFEERTIDWSPAFVFALIWLVVVLSVGAVGLLYTLIRRGEASRVVSLFYLTPPSTAILAWILFDERLGALALLGMAVAAAGVALVIWPTKGR